LSDAPWRAHILPRLRELFVAFLIAEVNLKPDDVLSHSHPVSTGWIEVPSNYSTVSTVFSCFISRRTQENRWNDWRNCISFRWSTGWSRVGM